MRWDVVAMTAALAIVPLLLLGWIVREVRKRNAALGVADAADRPPLACPLCGAAMTPGYVMAGRGIHWRGASDRPIGIFATVLSALPNTISIAIPPRENRAWRCVACSFVGVDHGALLARRRSPVGHPAAT